MIDPYVATFGSSRRPDVGVVDTPGRGSSGLGNPVNGSGKQPYHASDLPRPVPWEEIFFHVLPAVGNDRINSTLATVNVVE